MTTERLKIYHLLIIHDFSQTRNIILQGQDYSIGRDPRCSIVINNRGISREHAVLKQIPKGTSRRYAYQLQDGSVSGSRSRNGIKVNDLVCDTWELQPGDKILLGTVISAEYTLIKAPADLGLCHPNAATAQERHQRLPAAKLDLQRTLIDLSLLDMDMDMNPDMERMHSGVSKAKDFPDPEDLLSTVFFSKS
jgi:pSer/pThr/pTyr-binding forkhead associated (FHA) protein